MSEYYSQLITINTNKTKIIKNFYPVIHFPGPVELAFVQLSTVNASVNITEGNSKIWATNFTNNIVASIEIPEGGYSFDRLTETIKSLFKNDIYLNNNEVEFLEMTQLEINNIDHLDAYNNNDNLFSLIYNKQTLKSTLYLRKDVKEINITYELARILGFENNSNLYSEDKADKYTIFRFASATTSQPLFATKREYFDAKNITNVNQLKNIYVNVGNVQGIHVNEGLAGNVYSFYPNVTFGNKIVEREAARIYLPLYSKILDKLTVEITDQNGELWYNSNEDILLSFHIRSIKNNQIISYKNGK